MTVPHLHREKPESQGGEGICATNWQRRDSNPGSPGPQSVLSAARLRWLGGVRTDADRSSVHESPTQLGWVRGTEQRMPCPRPHPWGTDTEPGIARDVS